MSHLPKRLLNQTTPPCSPLSHTSRLHTAKLSTHHLLKFVDTHIQQPRFINILVTKNSRVTNTSIAHPSYNNHQFQSLRVFLICRLHQPLWSIHGLSDSAVLSCQEGGRWGNVHPEVWLQTPRRLIQGRRSLTARGSRSLKAVFEIFPD